MRTLPLSEAKAKLSELVDDVVSRDDRVTITRNGHPAAVLLSPDEVESWDETIAILRDPELTAEIRRGLRQLRSRRKTHTLDELFAPER